MKGHARGGNRGARGRLVFAIAAMLGLVFATAAAGDGPSRFALKGTAGNPVHTLAYPDTVQLADMNGDKKLDMVVSTAGESVDDGHLQVFLGNGKGGFTGLTAVAAGAAPASFTGDVNGDGKPDVVELDYGNSLMRVFLNDGHGALAQHGSAISVGGQPTQVVFGDFNGDHETDVAVMDSFPSELEIFLGDNLGGFAEAPDYQPNSYFASGSVSLATGDFDGNGTTDVAVLCNYGGAAPGDENVQLYWGVGDGTFTAGDEVSLPGLDPGWLIPADVNGDGKVDLVASVFPTDTTGGVVSMISDGSGNFTVSPVSPGPRLSDLVAADFTGDKKLDVYGADEQSNVNADLVALFTGNGAGQFAADPTEYADGATSGPGGTSADVYWLDAGDVNGDKKPDVVATNENTADPGQVSVMTWTSTVPAAPTLSKATPATGEVGDTITLTGKNLQHVGGISFGGPLGAIHQDTRTATSLQVDVPAAARFGKLGIVTQKGITASGVVFAPIEQPQIATVSPAGAQKPGAVVTITGIHFTAVSSVTVGATALTGLTVADGKITGKVPLGTTAGPATLTVTNIAGHDDIAYGVAAAPSYDDNFSPTHGAANKTKTTNVQLTSASGGLLGVSSVLFNGKLGTGVVVASDGTSLTVNAPAGATTGLITVKNPVGAFKGVTPFTVDPQPAIKTVSPGFGNTGDTITISGTNLIGITSVSFGGVPGTNLDTAGAPTSITVKVPPHAAIGKVTATGTNGTATSAATFTPHIAPILSTLSPTIGALPGATITVSGFHFAGTKTVAFPAAVGTVNGTFKIISDTSLSVKIPATAVTGTVNFTNAYGVTGANYYVIQTPVLAATGSFSPTAGAVTTAVTITGQHLGGTTSVTFNGESTSFTLDSDTQITAHPNSIGRSGVVGVTNAAGTATTTDSYTVVDVTDFSPSSGGIGQVVTVNGHGFLAVTGVSLPGQGETAPSLVTDTSFAVAVQSCAVTTTGPIIVWVGSIQISTGGNFALTSNGPC